MEFTYGKTVENMLVNGKIITCMAEDFIRIVIIDDSKFISLKMERW